MEGAAFIPTGRGGQKGRKPANDLIRWQAALFQDVRPGALRIVGNGQDEMFGPRRLGAAQAGFLQCDYYNLPHARGETIPHDGNCMRDCRIVAVD